MPDTLRESQVGSRGRGRGAGPPGSCVVHVSARPGWGSLRRWKDVGDVESRQGIYLWTGVVSKGPRSTSHISGLGSRWGGPGGRSGFRGRAGREGRGSSLRGRIGRLGSVPVDERGERETSTWVADSDRVFNWGLNRSISSGEIIGRSAWGGTVAGGDDPSGTRGVETDNSVVGALWSGTGALPNTVGTRRRPECVSGHLGAPANGLLTFYVRPTPRRRLF